MAADSEKKTDRRISILRWLRFITLFLLAVAVCVYVYAYRDDLNADNFRRILNYIDLGARGKAALGADAELETGVGSHVLPFRQGFAIIDNATLRFVNAAGHEDIAVQVAYGNPVLRTGSKHILAYDRGGSGFCITNTYAVLKNETLTSPIVTAGISDSGAFAVVTDEAGYRSAVTLYDASQTEGYKWYTSQYYAVGVCVSPDGASFAALCLFEEGGEFRTKLIGFDISAEEPVFETDLNGEYPLDAAYISGKEIGIVTEGGLYVIDSSSGEIKTSYSFTGDVCGFSVSNGAYPAAAETIHGGFRLVSFVKGAPVMRDFSGELRFLSVSPDTAALVKGETVYIMDRTFTDYTEPVTQSGVREISAGSSGSVAVSFSSRVTLIGS